MLALTLEPGMDPGTCRALGAMYKQPRRAFKIAGALGVWWQATNGILRACPLSVILVNVLTTVWKWEVESLRRQVCARMAALPPRYGIQMRVHDRRCSAQSRSAKQKSKRKALQYHVIGAFRCSEQSTWSTSILCT